MSKIAESISNSQPGQTAKLETLVQDVLKLGVTRAALISTKDISVDRKLADICRKPRCESYGLSKSCPPHVAGPAGFRKLLKKFSRAIFFKIDVPTELLFSSERREIFELLHELASGIEQQAAKIGFSGAQAYAGGSCKQIFCYDYPDCLALSENGKCRNPQSARPSMSGFGVNVAKLIETAGWTEPLIAQDAVPELTKMSSVYGLVLIH